MSWTRVDVSPTGGDGQLFAVTVAGHDLCLGMVAGIWYAIEDLCTHEECPLSDGFLDGVELECECHGAVFDIRTGDVLGGPAPEPVRTFQTRAAADGLEVKLP